MPGLPIPANKAELRLAGFTAELGVSRPAAQFALTDGEWYVPFPGIGDVLYSSVQDIDWTRDPISKADAAGAVIGVRSGEWVPVHDQRNGPHGVDGSEWAGEFPRYMVNPVTGDEEYFD